MPRGDAARGLDIGCGASCVYPLRGRAEYGWSCVGCDTSDASLALAQNAIHPMNFSRAYQPEPNPGRDPAGHGGVGSKLSCQLLDAVAAHVLPLSPRLQCDDGGAAIVEAAAA